MGHKVHPNAFRLGVYRSWEANWFALEKDYTKLLHEDLEMRRVILRRLHNAGIAKIETERSSNAQLTVAIHTAKPGIVIGKGGSSVDQLKDELEKRFQNRVRISIQEIKQPEMDAQLVAENIASQIERRISHRRAMKQAILRTMRAGALGVRIAMGGRLRGGEMARREWDREGRVPLHTLRADIDFGRATAKTTFGMIGVKCWIYKGTVRPPRRGGEVEAMVAPQPAQPGEPIAPSPEPPAAPAVAIEVAATPQPAVEAVVAPPAGEPPPPAPPPAAVEELSEPVAPAAAAEVTVGAPAPPAGDVVAPAAKPARRRTSKKVVDPTDPVAAGEADRPPAEEVPDAAP